MRGFRDLKLYLSLSLLFFLVQAYLNLKLFNSGVLKAYQRLHSNERLYLETLLAESLGEIRFTLAAQLWLLADLYLHKGEEQGEDPMKSGDLIYLMRFITFIDPHFVKAYDVGGYQLGMGLKRVEPAIDFLKEGIENNPDAFILYFDIGIIYIKVLGDCERGMRYLSKAREVILKHPPEDQWYFKFTLKNIYTLQAYCLFKQGRYDEVLERAERIKEIWPYGGDKIYEKWRRRVEEAERSRDNSDASSQVR